MSYFPATGSVVSFQSDPTKLLTHSSVSGSLNIVGNPSISGTVQVGNFPTNQNVSGSVVAFISGTVPVNAAGSVVSFQGTPPWAVNVGGSVITVSKDSSIIAMPTGTQNVSGSVVAFVSGTVPVNAAGSVVAFQGTSPWVVNFQNSSVLATPVGSTITVVQANSIVGTYAEDAGHTTADKGLATWGVRNDAVASFVSADLDYTPIAVDSAGRNLMKPFAASESQIEGAALTYGTASVLMVAAAGAGLRNYITDIMIANPGAATTLVTFTDSTASILGYTIAPTIGGSNIIGLATPIRTAANSAFNMTGTTITSLYGTVRGYRAP